MTNERFWLTFSRLRSVGKSMEPFVLLLGCILAVAPFAIHKRIARWRFRKAVAEYEKTRKLSLDAGARPSSVASVEQVLANRGELHLLREINHSFPARVEDCTTSEESSGNVFHDDDGYEKFVAEMWAKPAIDLGGVVVRRGHGTSEVECRLCALVEGDAGRLYLNLFEDGVRKTYAADSRHRWFVDGQEINYSAFVGVYRGADPRTVLRPDRYPASFEEAMSEQFDRFQTTDPRFAIAYQTVKGLSFRVISRVIRSDDTFSARCHFRWGERRTFRKAGLLDVFDMQVWDRIDAQAFLKKRAR